MAPSLPPPDPHESLDTRGVSIPAPTAVFLGGPATPEADSAADALLDLRPGLLIVVARD